MTASSGSTLNPLKTYVPYHIETSLLICSANQLTGFYMMGTLVVNGLNQPEEEDYQFEILEPKLLPLPSKLFLFIYN